MTALLNRQEAPEPRNTTTINNKPVYTADLTTSLVLLTRRADIMGELVNRPLTTVVAGVVAAVIVALNAFLLYQTLHG